MVMLQAFVDASGKGDPNVLVVAGYVARADEWARFSQAWKEKIDQAGLRRFKITEMSHRMEIAAFFYRTRLCENPVDAMVPLLNRRGK
jgi:hypothetical protein